MDLSEYPTVSLHNVAETVPAEWTDDGDRLCRVPATVGEQLNEMARDRVRHATGGEVRFVPEGDGEVEVTLSAAEPGQVRVFWGAFQPWAPTEIGPEPETLTLNVPEKVSELAVSHGTGRFDPRVCRVLFERTPAVAVHDVSGDCRPPRDEELPDHRYLAYGTSITEGAAASATHTDYVTRVARDCGFDALNFGSSGSAYCEAAMAEYIASRDDWDLATLALSVNMANTGGFAPETFHERAETFVNTVAGGQPDKPVVCVTLFPYFDDFTGSGDAEHATAYRDALRSIVDESPHDNLTLVEGPDLLEISGLTSDLLHPGDHGMATIGERLAERLRDVSV